jgi:hypothetical protein
MPDVEVVRNYNSEELPPADFVWCLNGNRTYFAMFPAVHCRVELLKPVYVLLSWPDLQF